MKIYILHYAQMDSEGNLSIDCDRFSTIQEAKDAQTNLNNIFKKTVNQNPEDIIFEEIGTFNRLEIKGSLAEIQSHIEEFQL